VKEYIKGITDDYLIGLSNKGIVKRGHKDYDALENPPVLHEVQDSIMVEFSEAQVVLRSPLSEASCSCPSKALCKHIVMAVLAVQAQSGEADTPAVDQNVQNDDTVLAADAAASQKERTPSVDSLSLEGEKTEKQKERASEKQAQQQVTDIAAAYPEMYNIPADRLMRAWGWGKGKKKEEAGMEEALRAAQVVLNANTIVVQALRETVTLLEPFSASKCTCKKSSLCSHKAFAALAVRYQYNPETLQPALEEYMAEQQKKQGKLTQDIDKKQEEIVGEVLAFLVDFMNVGLNRASESNADELLRLSIISHNAGMPNLEQRLRQIEQEWIHHHKGGGISKTPVFLDRICNLYELAVRYLAKEEKARQALIGVFRAEYEAADDCRLYGITNRAYDGKGGFIGNIYYFLDWEKEQILVYQDIRPNVYEGRKKSAEAMLKEEAPWGLDIRKEDLAGKEILLREPKLSEDGKLSASQSTRGEFMGAISLTREMMGEYYYEDFTALLDYYLTVSEEMNERRRLVFIKPERIEKTPYDEVAQQFRAALLDREGCVVWLQIDYHKSREYLIRHMTRLFDRMEKHKGEELVLFGVVSVGEHGLLFYPYEYFLYDSAQRRCL